MILSIVVYTSLALVLFALAQHLNRREQLSLRNNGQYLPFWSWEIILSIVIFAAVAGARYHTGFDHAAYLDQYFTYQRYGYFTRDYEPLFTWITQLMAGAKIHFFFYFAFWAALELALLYYALNKHKHLIPWVALLLVLGPTFVHLMNTMRQGVVECAVPLLLTYKFERKYFQMLSLICVLILLHYTAALLFLLFLLPLTVPKCRFSKNWLRLLAVALLLLSIALSSNPIWLEWMINFITRFCSEPISRYIYAHHFKSAIVLPFGPMKLVMTFVQLFFLWYIFDVVSNSKKPLLVYLYAIVSLVYVFACNLLAYTECYFQRPFELFCVCFLVLIALIVYNLMINNKKHAAYSLLACYCSYIIVVLIKVYLMPDALNMPFLYRTFLFQ